MTNSFTSHILQNKSAFKSHYRIIPQKVKKILCESYEQIDSAVLLDFGCNFGLKTLGLLDCLPISRAIGCDINNNFDFLTKIVRTADDFENIDWNQPSNLNFFLISCGEQLSRFLKADIIFSWSVFEHVDLKSIEAIIADLHNVLSNEGIFFIQINPLYYSPYGSHLASVLTEPWIHLTISEENLKKRLFESAKNKCIANGLWSTYMSLNRLKINEILSIFTNTGFIVLNIMQGRSRIKPQSKLLEWYAEDDLTTEGFNAVLKKK